MKRFQWKTRKQVCEEFANLRETKRQREEAKRWIRFEKDREAFDRDLENTLDVYELMMRNQDGCGW